MHRDAISHVMFIPKTQSYVTASQDSTMRVWSGGQQLKPLATAQGVPNFTLMPLLVKAPSRAPSRAARRAARHATRTPRRATRHRRPSPHLRL